ncbi:MAG: Crp/Fnr family transcriptional regulator, partial [Halothiobacillaceae bacterium]
MGAVAEKIITSTLLRELPLLSDMSNEQLEQLARQAVLTTHAPGQDVFKQTIHEDATVYLLGGVVICFTPAGERLIIKAGSPQAKQPLKQQGCAAYNTIAQTSVTLFHVDCTMFHQDIDQQPLPFTASINEPPPKNSNAWLTRFLAANAFLSLPAGHLQTLIAELEQIDIKNGQRVMQQGAETSYYYIIKQGRLVMSRKLDSSQQTVDLMELNPGDGFGEDLLAPSGLRYASVIAIDDCQLMRITKKSFETLLVKPLLSTLTYAEAQTYQQQGALLIDTRAAEEHLTKALPNSVNIPLALFRPQLHRLEPQRDYILYGNEEHAGAAALFLLKQKGYKAHLLAGGIDHIMAQESNTTAPSLTPSNLFQELAELENQLQALEAFTQGSTHERYHPPVAGVEEPSVPVTNDAPLTPKEKFSLVIPTAEGAHGIPHGWLADEHLWNDMLGYRSDPAIDKLFLSTLAVEEQTEREEVSSVTPPPSASATRTLSQHHRRAISQPDTVAEGPRHGRKIVIAFLGGL